MLHKVYPATILDYIARSLVSSWYFFHFRLCCKKSSQQLTFYNGQKTLKSNGGEILVNFDATIDLQKYSKKISGKTGFKLCYKLSKKFALFV